MYIYSYLSLCNIFLAHLSRICFAVVCVIRYHDNIIHIHALSQYQILLPGVVRVHGLPFTCVSPMVPAIEPYAVGTDHHLVGKRKQPLSQRNEDYLY